MRLFLFVHLITDNKTNNVSNQTQKCLTRCGKGVVRCHGKKGLKKMKFNFLQKQTSRREMLRGSAALAGCAFLAHLFPARLLHASAAGYAQEARSDALAAMRDWFNAFPLETERLGEDVTMLSGPGGSVVVLNGPDGKFVVDTFVAPAWPRLKEALYGLGNAPVKY